MKTSFISISIICFVLLLSCSKPHPIPEVTEDPCLNGGELSTGGGLGWSSCDCPDGFCGVNCEIEAISSVYGNYDGIMVCQGDSIAIQFEVVEYECDYNPFELGSQDRLLFNDRELIAKYWKTYENTGLDNDWIPFDLGEISINYGENNYVVGVNGRLTPDSLSFWVIEYYNSTDTDTCFYVGVRN